MKRLEKAYSLVEVLIAVILVSFVGLAMVQLMTLMHAEEKKAEDNIYVINRAQGIMEKIMEAPYVRIQYGVTLPPTDFELPEDASTKVPLSSLVKGYYSSLDGYYQVKIEEKNDAVAGSDYKILTVTVGWYTVGSHRQHREYGLVTRIYPELTM